MLFQAAILVAAQAQTIGARKQSNPEDHGGKSQTRHGCPKHSSKQQLRIYWHMSTCKPGCEEEICQCAQHFMQQHAS
jgi:hypothetical protein